ncbi:MAG: hypothetical protein GQ535_12350 [Rhodobacteraceae bacterium]|nr:hypothetical protein [Paracoccaceae bacterium]
MMAKTLNEIAGIWRGFLVDDLKSYHYPDVKLVVTSGHHRPMKGFCLPNDSDLTECRFQIANARDLHDEKVQDFVADIVSNGALQVDIQRQGNFVEITWLEDER